MSTAAPPNSSRQNSTRPGTPNLIEDRLEEAKRALWWSEVIRASLRLAIAAMIALLFWLVVDHWVYSPGVVIRALLFVAAVAASSAYLILRWWPIVSSSVTDEYAAWSLEQDHQDYRQQLTSYVTLKRSGAPRSLRGKVVRAIGSRAASLLKTFDHLPHEATGTFRWWIAAAVAFAILMTYLVASPKSSVASWKRLAMPLASLAPVRRVTIEEVEPGNTSALAGRLIEVSANVRGLRDQESVVCRWSDPVSEESSQLAYDRSSERFRGDLRLSQGASGIVRYTIEAGDAVAGPFEIEVEDVPVVAVQSVRYEPPAYTRRKATVTSSPAIQALDGTEIEIIATTSRPVARAELQFNCREVRGDIEPTGGTLAMTLTDGGNVLSAKRRLRKNAGTAAVELENYRIKVWDTDERSNPNPIVYPIQVIADLAPEVTIVVPTKSPVRVPISAQQIIEVHAMDADFELDRVMLELKRGLDTFDTPLLWQRSEAQSGRGNQVSEYRFRPSAHRLRVGDTIQVTAVAIDNRSLEDGSSAGPNQSRTDALEIQIVDDRSKEVPEDPVGNDGLSQPDDRPASQAESSRDEQGKGDSKSGDESGGEQGGGEQGSREQGGSGAQGSGSGEQNPQQQGEQGDNGQQGSGSVQSQGEPSESADAQDGQSGSGSNAGQPGSDPSETGSQNNGGGEPGADGQSSGANPNQPEGRPQGNQNGSDGESTPAGSDSAGSDAGAPGSEDSSGEPSGSGEGQDGSMPSGSGSSGEGTDPNQSPTPDSRSPESGSPDNSSEAPSEGGKSNGAGQDSSSANRESPEASAERDPNPGQGSSSSSAESSGQDASNRPPKHDGEAMERIKDYIERKRQQEESQRGGSGNASEESGTSDGRESADDNAGGGEPSQQQSSGRGDEEQANGDGANEDRTNGDREGQAGNESSSDESSSDESPSDESPSDGTAGDASPDASQEPSDTAGSDTAGSDTAGSDSASPQGEAESQAGESAQGESSDPSSSASEDGRTNDGGADSESSTGADSRRRDGSSSERPSDDRGSAGNQQERGDSDAARGSREGEDANPMASESSNASESNSANERGTRQPAGKPQSSSQSVPSPDGSGSGQESSEGNGSATPPPPPDMEYAKKATGMVLDYLDESRDQVDPDLLKDLNWTEEDLRRFQRRWENIRKLDQPQTPPSETNELEDALRSLGLQPRSQPASRENSTTDGLRGIRDSGNRRKAPPAFRDAFEAFRSRKR